MPASEQLLVFVDAEIKKQLKIYSVNQGLPMKLVVEEALKSHLGMAEAVGAAPASYDHECKKCGRGWSSSKADPRVCPYCKSYSWRESGAEGQGVGKRQYSHQCEPCGNKWENGIAEPKACPSCGSKAWKAGSPANLHAKFTRALKQSSRGADVLAAYSGIEDIAEYVTARKPVTQELLAQLMTGIKKCKEAEARQQEKEKDPLPDTLPWSPVDDVDVLW